MNDLAVITLCGSKGGFAVVDADLFEDLNRRRWYANAKGYIHANTWDPTTKRGSRVALHRVVNKTPAGMHTDHINHDLRDCTRRNLRTCARSENMMNQRPQAGAKSSAFKGVHWHKGHRKWVARIKLNQRSYELGEFDDEALAAAAYNAAATRVFGEFANPNTL
jgi:HNH endonuclease